MSVVAISSQDMFTIDNSNYVLSSFVYNASGDTVSVPTGTLSAAAVSSDGVSVAPTTSISAGATADTVTLTGGTIGVIVTLLTKHAGSLAGNGAR